MRGYRFRLQPVLRVRQLQEEQSRVELAMARRAEDAAHAATATRRSRFAAARNAPVDDPSPLAHTRRRDHQSRMIDALVASQVAEAHASDLRRRSQDDWEAAVVALRTMERLDERARAEHRLETARQEQMDLDELATSRAGTTRAAGSTAGVSERDGEGDRPEGRST